MKHINTVFSKNTFSIPAPLHRLAISTLICFFILLYTTPLSAQSFADADGYGASHFDKALSIAGDNADNLYMIGTFIGNWGWREGDTLKSAGGTDFVMARLDAQGQPIWMRSGGGRVDDELAHLAVSPDGSSLYAAGWIRDTLVLEDNIIATEGLSGDDAFLVKYDNNGNFQWARQWAGKGISRITALLTDNAGQVYVGGIFTDSLLLNNNNDTLVSAGGFDMLMARYDADGNLLGYKQLGGTQTEMLNTMTLAPNGYWYIGGYFVGNTGLGAFNLESNGETDAFLLQSDTDGNVWWVKQFGSEYAEAIEHIAANSDGKLALSGVFSQQSLWENTLLNAWGSSDIVLAQTDADGNLQWAVSMGSQQPDAINDMTTDDQNNIYLAGTMGGNMAFGGSLFLTSSGNSDAFAAKFAPDGTPLWAQAGGGYSTDSGNSIWVGQTDNSRYCYLAGSYILAANFETISLSSNGTADMFMAKIDQSNIDVAIYDPKQYPTNTTFNAYPNPAAGGSVWVNIPPVFAQTADAKLTLSTPNGQVVYQTNLAQESGTAGASQIRQIPLQNLPQGIYILTLTNEKISLATRIFVW